MLIFVSHELLKVIHKPQNGVSSVTGLRHMRTLEPGVYTVVVNFGDLKFTVNILLVQIIRNSLLYTI
jgi:hypothetical protein